MSMRRFLVITATSAALVIAGWALLQDLLAPPVGLKLAERLDGADGTPPRVHLAEDAVRPEGELVRFDGVASDLPGAWPRFRGPNGDGISREEISLAKSWPTEGPKVLWSLEVGEGYAAAAVLSGRVYVLDYDRARQRDIVRCLSLEDGKDIWQYSYPVKVKRNHGMSRTVPAVTEEYVVTLGPKCHVTCLDSVTGELRWMIDLVHEYKATVPLW